MSRQLYMRELDGQWHGHAPDDEEQKSLQINVEDVKGRHLVFIIIKKIESN